MIRAEWRYLIKHKLLLIVLAVIMLIPSIYAVTFLKSMWDPYGKLDDLPIAVVNQDHAVQYQGKTLAAGKNLTTNLKHATSMKFIPVSHEAAAKRGLKNGTYYMVITIPKDFSYNATTLMQATPHQMILHDETSAGHSFIAAKLTATAAKSAAQAVSDTVTQSYAKTMFATIKQLGTGLTTAGRGSQQLANGGQQLTNADRKIATGLNTLAASTVKLTNGDTTITTKLNQYVGGVQQAQNGSEQLATGLNQLLTKSHTLTTGVQQLATGSRRVTSGVNAYTQGTNQLTTAAGKLASGSQTVKTGTQQLSRHTAELAKGSQQLTGNFSKLETGSVALTNGLKQLQAGLKSSQTQQDQLKQAVAQLATDQQSSNAVFEDATKLQTALDTLTNDNSHQNTALQNKLAATADAQGLTATQKAAMLKAASDSSTTSTDISTAQSAAKQLSHDLTDLKSAKSETTSLNSSLTKATSAQSDLATGLTTLTTNAATLTSGLQQANHALTQLNTGIGSLATATPTLTNGTTQLAEGSSKLATGGQKLIVQTPRLTAGTAALTSGLTNLNRQTPQLTAGVGKLANGADTLNTGLATLATNGSRLATAMTTATAGSSALHTGAAQLATGATQATTGATKVQSGNANLATTLHQAGRRATVHPSQLTYKQFAQPTTTAHSDPDRAPDNGTGMAPYMMSVSLFVGALAFNLMFDMYTPRKYPRSGWGWWLGKSSIMSAFVLGEALFMTGLLAAIDGLTPIHPWATFMMLLITGGAFMSIVYWLNLVFGKPGAFFSMVLLVLQLGGSAGTYPLQLTNGFFRAIHPWLPMSYSVDGLRETLMIGNSAIPEMLVLCAIATAFSGMGILFYARRHGRINEMDIPEL